MSQASRRFMASALLAGVALPLMVGCPFLLGLIVLKICIKNETCLELEEFNVVESGSASWGPNLLAAEVAAGGSDVVDGFSPNTYDIRAIFDDKDDCVSNDVYILEGVELDTTNLCITYSQEFDIKADVGCCADIYATLDYVI